MYSSDQILAALQGGKSPEDVAQDFANALNAAIKEKSEKEAAAKKNSAKVVKLQKIIDEFCEWNKEFYPGATLANVPNPKAEDLITELDKTLAEMAKMKSMLSDLEKLFKYPEEKRNVIKPPTASKKPVDPITEFLKKEGLI